MPKIFESRIVHSCADCPTAIHHGRTNIWYSCLEKDKGYERSTFPATGHFISDKPQKAPYPKWCPLKEEE